MLLNSLVNIRGMLSVTDLMGTTSLPMSQDAAAGHTQGESLLRLYPQTKELISTSTATKGVNLINELYEIERSFEALTPAEKHKQRQERLKPSLDAFFCMA